MSEWNADNLSEPMFWKAKWGKKKELKEFILTKHLSVRLEHEKTIIYVDGNKFNQCKYLLLTLDNKDAWKNQEEFTSIDEVAKYLGSGHENDSALISPETEFWGHCSNLQAWVENNYDLRVIHTNLGFPLLKRLAEYDKNALISLKEEIIFRVEKTGYKAYEMHKSVINKFFNAEENELLINTLRENILSSIDKNDYKYSQYLKFKHFIEEFFTKEEKEEVLEEVKSYLIIEIKQQYQSLDIFSLLKRNCTLCKHVFSITGHKCTFCTNYDNYSIREGIIIPKENYSNLKLNHLALPTLLRLRQDLKTERVDLDIKDLPLFAGGAGMDNDMTARGDYIYTLFRAKRSFEEEYNEYILPFRILTVPEIRDRARTGWHFYELTGSSEYDRLIGFEDVEIWEISNDIEPDVMYIYDQQGNGIKTGRLTI